MTIINSLKNKYILIALLSVGVAILFYFRPKTPDSIEQSVKIVEVVTAEPSRIAQKVRLIGVLRAVQSAELNSKASGIVDVHVPSGQFITKGTEIARIINVDLEKHYTLAESAVMIAQNQLDRALSLSKTGTSSKQSTEEKESALLTAQNNLITAKIERDKYRVSAPFDGVVGAYKVRAGSEVKADTLIVTFYDATRLMVEFDIPATVLEHVNVGQKVEIDNKTYTLTAVQKMLDESTHMAPAHVDIDAKNGVIGETKDVDLTLVEKENVIVLPDEAVFLEKGKPHVYVIKDSKTVLTPVKLGIRFRDQVEITQGLTAGDIIVALGQSRLWPDLVVKIHEPMEKRS